MEDRSRSRDTSDAFFVRAAEEAHRYGADPWVFLRELVQNSRDAHAHRIDFSVNVSEDSEDVACDDDGVGMSADVVQQYLLRLYASTKVEDGSVGYFGVGFWSILRFQPRTITVMSRSKDGTIGLEIDCRSRAVATIPVTLSYNGTRVRVTRDIGSGPQGPGGLRAIVRDRLLLYAAHVRPFRGEPPVELWLDGERIDCGFPAPPYGLRRLSGDGFDAVVGFGPEPLVRIYTAGILVRAVASLDEVIPSRAGAGPRGGWGLYPVVYLNVDRLLVLMDRHNVFEDQRLKDALHRCEHELIAAHHRLLRSFLPLDLRNLWWSTFGRLRVRAVVVALVVVACAAALARNGILGRWPLSRQASVVGSAASQPPRTLDEIEETLSKDPFPSVIGSGSQTWDFSYEGPAAMIFIARLLTAIDPDRGFRAEPLLVEGPYPEYPDTGGQRIGVRMRVAGATSLMALPIPPGHVVVTHSVRHDNAATQIWRGRMGEALISSPSPGWVSYVTVPRTKECACSPFSPEGLPWPDSMARLLAAVHGENAKTRVEILRALVRRSFVYTRSDPHVGQRGWLQRALTAGRGDCDVINGVMAALLRSAGIEAHLAVGIVGMRGQAIPPLHAVVTYCIDGWHVLDLTGEVPSEDSPPPGSGVRAPEPREEMLRPSSRDPVSFLTLIAVVASGLGAAGFAVERHARRTRLDPLHIRHLLDHLYDGSGLGAALRYRPVVPLLGGRRVSLFQIERMAGRRGLFGARPGDSAVRHARGRALIDRSSPLTPMLEPYLPPITWLDDPFWDDPLPDHLIGVERVLRAINDGLRIHRVRGSSAIRVVSVARAEGGRYHVLLGDEHPVAAIVEEVALGGSAGVMSAAGVLVRALPFYFRPADGALAALDHAALVDKTQILPHRDGGETRDG